MTPEELLVIHEGELMRDQLTNIVERKLGSTLVISRESNFEHARKLLDQKHKNWAMVVMSETARADVRTRPEPLSINSPACCFVRELRKNREIPVLGLGKPGSCHLKDQLESWNQTAYALDDDFQGIAERIEALNSNRPLEPALELEWELGDAANNFWRVQAHGMNSWKVGPKSFTIDSEQVKILLGMSVALMSRPSPHWLTMFNGVGSLINNLLFDARQNSDLLKVFYREVAKVGEENLRISFKLSPRWQQAVVEALNGDTDIRQSWMLTSPTVRRYSVQGDPSKKNATRLPLYSAKKQRDEKVNCLIIAADPQYKEIVEGNWAGQYWRLEDIQSEAEKIAAFLQGKRDKVGADCEVGEVGDVRLIDLEGKSINIQKTVLDALGEKDWHIVHFAGHGVIGKDGTAALMLSPRLGEALKFLDLANALTGTQFLFVSSCRSADSTFIENAISSSIPAVIGYRWEVKDDEAAALAEEFYTALFTKGQTYKSVEKALLFARKQALKFNAAGNTWASPVLLTQTIAQAAA
jgi:CHAT domain-containing protein